MTAPKTEEKTAHTPGPWIASDVIRQRGKCYRTIRKEGRFKLAEVFAFNENAPPFLFGADGSREGKEEEEANARLIAAAPDMAALLAQLREMLATNAKVDWSMQDAAEEFKAMLEYMDEAEGNQ